MCCFIIVVLGWFEGLFLREGGYKYVWSVILNLKVFKSILECFFFFFVGGIGILSFFLRLWNLKLGEGFCMSYSGSMDVEENWESLNFIADFFKM